jgi:hypothetical protein
MADVTTLTQTGMDKATGIKLEAKGKYYGMCFFLLFLQCIVNDYSLLVPAKAHIILIYISYMFQLVTILGELTAK